MLDTFYYIQMMRFDNLLVSCGVVVAIPCKEPEGKVPPKPACRNG